MKKNTLLLWVILGVVFIAAPGWGRDVPTSYSPSEITKVVFLGTGTPNPDPRHSGNSVAVVVNQTPYIIDFGPGLVRSAAALSPRYGGKIPALSIENLKRAFLTHLHSDHTTGYPDLIFTPPDRRIAISGDTRPCKNLVEKCKGVDILVHEVYSREKLKERTPFWQKYHPQFHTSTHELAEIAAQIKPGFLLLYHQLGWGASDEELVKEITDRYNGKVVSAKDLEVY
jgi:ribonuclease BN (tRNA processing enzyme)